MKKIAPVFIFLLLYGCAYRDSETDQLNRRITLLEQRVDSLTGGQAYDSMGFRVSRVPEGSRCQKITKKGTQCKRKAKNSGYCWQHAKG